MQLGFEKRPSIDQSPPRFRAFTLVEMLVVIFVSAVLLALLLPALGSAIETSRRARSASNLRQIHTVFETYTTTHQGRFPTADPDTTGSYEHACVGALIGVRYWSVTLHWTWVVQPVAPWSEYREVFIAPSALREDETCGSPTSYFYSASFLARPETWSPGFVADRALLEPATDRDVVFPSAKVLM